MARQAGGHFARIEPADLAALRAWFAAHHAQTESVWIVYQKKAAGGAFAAGDITDEALCFGWIDSLPRKLDEARAMLLVSPRKKGSGWSKVNKAKIARLAAEGRIAAPGHAVIARAKADGSWEKLDSVDALAEPADLVAALKRAKGAKAQWDAFPPSARRGILEWLGAAKTEATRAKRLADIVEKAARGERANQWRVPARKPQG